MDVRREINSIHEKYRKYQHITSEFVVWYPFLPLGTNVTTTSVYDDVYDEGIYGAGGRKYGDGVVIPVLLVTETEDARRSIADGRQPTQTIEAKISIRDMRDAGIENVWEYQPHLNDIFIYDGRFYGLSDYRVRGRLKAEVFVIVQGFEIYVDQEFVNDIGPPALTNINAPWPTSLPTIG
jgi:hypothetical protein